MILKKVFFPAAVICFVIWLASGYFNSIRAQSCNCDYTIEPHVVYVDGSRLKLKPGSTICIKAGKKQYLKLENFKGSPSAYLTFINCGGQVQIKNNFHFGISLENCQFFRFTGSGDSKIPYGFKIEVSHPEVSGLSAGKFSSFFEIDHIEVARAGFAGIMSKTDPGCDPATQRGQFVQRMSSFHDNFIHDVHGEGIYIGSSFYSGYPITCRGKKQTVYPHDIVGLRIYDNIISNVGWDGIQVGCAIADCEIYNNNITNYGNACAEAQMSGIQLNSGTSGKCYNNLIRHGMGHGITVFGLGNNMVYNNVIINAGRRYFPEDASKPVYGIFCDDRATIAGRSFYFINNTIISPKSEGIRVLSVLSMNNRIANNVIINPGAYWLYERDNTHLSGSDAYINVTRRGVKAQLFNNFCDMSFERARFADIARGNFELQAGSRAIDTGAETEMFGISTDFYQQPRKIGMAADAGAYEFNPQQQRRSEKTSSIAPHESGEEVAQPMALQWEIYPNPVSNLLYLSGPSGRSTRVEIRDLSGKILLSSSETTLDVSSLPTGVYLLLIFSREQTSVQKFEKL